MNRNFELRPKKEKRKKRKRENVAVTCVYNIKNKYQF